MKGLIWSVVVVVIVHANLWLLGGDLQDRELQDFVDQALEVSLARESAFRAYCAKIEVETYENEKARTDGVVTQEERIWLQQAGDSKRVDVTSLDPANGKGLYETVTWNGGLGKTWIRRLESPDVGSGRIVVEPPAYVRDSYPEQYFAAVAGMFWSDVFRNVKLAPGESVTNTKMGTVRSHISSKISIEGGIPHFQQRLMLGSSTVELNVWFDKGKFMAPAHWKMESLGDSDGKTRRLLCEFEVEQWAEYDGMWLPKQVKRTSFLYRVHVANVEFWFRKGSATDIDFSWPKGASVWDEASNKGFFAR